MLAIAGVMRIVRLLRLARPVLHINFTNCWSLYFSRLLRGFLVCHELRLLVTGTGLLFNVAVLMWATPDTDIQLRYDVGSSNRGLGRSAFCHCGILGDYAAW